MRFDGKAGLVTGAGSGIGRATALGFARRGGAVAVVDIRADAADEVVAEISKAGGKAIAIVADVSRAEDIDMMIARAERELGGLHFLHNNAFGLPAASAERQAARVADTSDVLWNHTIEVGLNAVFRTIRRAIPVMKANGGGAIVNTASISGLRADSGMVAYNAAKAGVINLTRVVAVEYARDGIRCNCVCPGVIETPLIAGALRIPGVAERFHEGVPMARLGQPDEIANAVLFLASELASFVTGAALVADGGQTAKTGNPSFFKQ